MKQFAITFAAIFAATAFAQEEEEEKPFAIAVSYADDQNIFLGLEVDNPATIKLPRSCSARAARQAEIECSGWQLFDENAAYTDFSIVK